jgi:quinol monooxygenase YgiN
MKLFSLVQWSLMLTVASLLMTAPLRAQAPGAVHVATYLDVRPASTRDGATLTAQYVRDTRADTGNLMVSAYQEIGRDNRFVVIETWQDHAAFTSHEKAAKTVAFRDKLKAIHNSPYDQRINTGFAIDPATKTGGSRAIYVVTHVDVPGAMRTQAETLLKQLFESSRVDAGHIRYDVYQQYEPRTNHFTVFAAWDSQRAFEAYGSTPHWLQFREALAPMLGALYDERLYKPLKP